MKHFRALAVTALLAVFCGSALADGERVVVFLKAKPGAEKALLESTRQWMVDVRKVPGLERADINVQNDDPSMLVLYYHWKTKEHGDAYRKSDLFKQAVSALEPFVAERRLVLTTNVD